jgi:hypothetical protein
MLTLHQEVEQRRLDRHRLFRCAAIDVDDGTRRPEDSELAFDLVNLIESGLGGRNEFGIRRIDSDFKLARHRPTMNADPGRLQRKGGRPRRHKQRTAIPAHRCRRGPRHEWDFRGRTSMFPRRISVFPCFRGHGDGRAYGARPGMSMDHI